MMIVVGYTEAAYDVMSRRGLTIDRFMILRNIEANADGQPQIRMHVCTHWKPGKLAVRRMLDALLGKETT